MWGAGGGGGQIDQDSVKQKPMEPLPQPAVPPPIPVNEVIVP